MDVMGKVLANSAVDAQQLSVKIEQGSSRVALF
jgi:hypothetical protein